MNHMKIEFEVEFLREVVEFLHSLNEKERGKIIYNIDKTRYKQDPELFKILTSEIWEFRTLYNNKCFRVFAFWQITQQNQSLIIATHGIIKKSNKTPKQDIEKAERIRKAYLNSKR